MNLDELAKPTIMGILNVTPDSFSDGGRYNALDKAMFHAHEMIGAGADIIDIGGESTRPGAAPISVAEELERVIPVVTRLRAESKVFISVDTSTPEVMIEAAKLGVNMINDVRALQRDGALEAAAESDLPVCLMHMQGRPATMQINPQYSDVISEVRGFFDERINACTAAGIKREKILLDPGFGFGKTAEHNLMLINRLTEFQPFGLDLVIGLSRKSTLTKLVEGDDTLVASVAGALIAVMHGASIVRVHDVAETAQALAVLIAIRSESVQTVD